MHAKKAEARVLGHGTPSEALEEKLTRILNPIFSGGWQQSLTRDEALAKVREAILAIPPFLWHGKCDIAEVLSCIERNWDQLWEGVCARKTFANKATAAILRPCFPREEESSP